MIHFEDFLCQNLNESLSGGPLVMQFIVNANKAFKVPIPIVTLQNTRPKKHRPPQKNLGPTIGCPCAK